MFRHQNRGALRRGIAMATAIGVFVLAQAAHATATFYDVQVVQGLTTTDTNLTGSGLISAASSGAAGGTSFDYSVFAGIGTLGDKNDASIALGVEGSSSVRSNTNFLETNITVTGPAGSPLVSFSANFDLTGSINLSASAGSSAFGSININDKAGTLGVLAVDTFAPFDSNTGIFAGVTPTASTKFNVSGTTSKQLVGNHGLASVFLNMATDAIGTTSPSGGTASSMVDALDPLSLSTQGPVFNFFDPVTGAPVTGWTANSADGCIANNLFTCGIAAPTPTPSSADEPPSLALLGAAALAGLIWTRRSPQTKAA